MKTVILIIAIMFAPASVLAGTLEKVESQHCEYRFQGLVEPGDADKFAALAKRNSSFSICLASGGGSFLEAMQISRIIWESNARTIVARSDKCFSACAAIFLSGSTDGRYGRLSARSVIHGGALGVHRPGLPTEAERSGPPALLTAIYDEALKAAAEINRLRSTGSDGVSILNDFVFDAIMRTDDGENYQFNTVGDFILAEVWLEGLAVTAPSPKEAAQNFCDNVYVAHVRPNFIADDLVNPGSPERYSKRHIWPASSFQSEFEEQPNSRVWQVDNHYIGWVGPYPGRDEGSVIPYCFVQMPVTDKISSQVLSVHQEYRDITKAVEVSAIFLLTEKWQAFFGGFEEIGNINVRRHKTLAAYLDDVRSHDGLPQSVAPFDDYLSKGFPAWYLLSHDFSVQ